MKNEDANKAIKIRINLNDKDPLYSKFEEIKEKLMLNANTEVIRYAIKKIYEIEIKEKKNE